VCSSDLQVNATLSDPVERGQKWAEVNGCISCHSLDGSKLVGPTWKGLAGEEVTLAEGSTVTADDAYLRNSIDEPNAQIVQGYPANVMPATYSALLTDEQINDLIAYIHTVK
jgi:cytochrome c oxidase subunit 2